MAFCSLQRLLIRKTSAVRVIEKSSLHFVGTHKGATINIETEPDGGFYIIVTARDGGHLYDGWAPKTIRTMADAKREAISGAGLITSSPTP